MLSFQIYIPYVLGPGALADEDDSDGIPQKKIRYHPPFPLPKHLLLPVYILTNSASIPPFLFPPWPNDDQEPRILLHLDRRRNRAGRTSLGFDSFALRSSGTDLQLS
ncbi:hypothetical protein BV22DRAFT_1031276 [Leucogyrophana mollusca]|uniref:Uncharacterized protein n=1 Tax=Leucogyrophana mollusca TaxID=85980 RepID=A0ACB8BQZ0_9AGAM|nr:hypothetical protein BV22DRAFT_1031276 [Leucogyrophana mollusca]